MEVSMPLVAAVMLVPTVLPAVPGRLNGAEAGTRDRRLEGAA